MVKQPHRCEITRPVNIEALNLVINMESLTCKKIKTKFIHMTKFDHNILS